MQPLLYAAAKYVPAPLAAGWWLVSSEPPLIRSAIDIAALVSLIAVVFVGARYRATIDAQGRSGEALARELEAQRERGDRLEDSLAEKNAEWLKFSEEQRELRHQLKDQLAEANARTDLTGLTKLIVESNQSLRDQLMQALKETR